jgi:hypothetical protein
MKQCVLIAGPLHYNSLPILINDYSNFSDKFVTTWDNENPESIKRLEENGFTVILNALPEIRNAQHYQKKSILGGLEHIKALGVYTHVLRTRVDFHITDVNKLMERYASYDETKPTFLTWFKNRADEPGYLMNQLLYGPLDFMEKYYGAEWQYGETRFDELFFQENYFEGEKPLKYNDIRDKVNLSLNDLINDNIELYWTNKQERVDEGNLFYRYTHCPCRYVGSTADEFIDFPENA